MTANAQIVYYLMDKYLDIDTRAEVINKCISAPIVMSEAHSRLIVLEIICAKKLATKAELLKEIEYLETLILLGETVCPPLNRSFHNT